MKLTTEKPLIVFYDKTKNSYKYCGVRYFESSYKIEEIIPILYTDSLLSAKDVRNKLNKELRA